MPVLGVPPGVVYLRLWVYLRVWYTSVFGRTMPVLEPFFGRIMPVLEPFFGRNVGNSAQSVLHSLGEMWVTLRKVSSILWENQGGERLRTVRKSEG